MIYKFIFLLIVILFIQCKPQQPTDCPFSELSLQRVDETNTELMNSFSLELAGKIGSMRKGITAILADEYSSIVKKYQERHTFTDTVFLNQYNAQIGIICNRYSHYQMDKTSAKQQKLEQALERLEQCVQQYAKRAPVPHSEIVNTSTGVIHAIVSKQMDDAALGIDESVSLIDEHLNKVSQHTPLKINRSYLNKDSTEEHLSILKNLKCEPNDVIFFVYIGHGYNVDGDKFPAYNSNNLIRFRLEVVQKKLKEKNPRLLIMLYATSNWILGTSDSAGVPRPHINSFFYENELDINIQNEKAVYNKFYLYAKGDISLSNASLGAYSYSKSVKKSLVLGGGTFFMENFVNAFNIPQYRSGWKQLLWYVREQTHLSVKAAADAVPNYHNRNITTFYPYFEGNVTYMSPN